MAWSLERLEHAVAELGRRYPNRVGLKFISRDVNCTDHCITGQIQHDAGFCNISTLDPAHPFYMYVGDPAVHALLGQVVIFNNAGVPWGEIARRVVPQSQPVAPAVTESELVEV